MFLCHLVLDDAQNTYSSFEGTEEATCSWILRVVGALTSLDQPVNSILRLVQTECVTSWDVNLRRISMVCSNWQCGPCHCTLKVPQCALTPLLFHAAVAQSTLVHHSRVHTASQSASDQRAVALHPSFPCTNSASRQAPKHVIQGICGFPRSWDPFLHICAAQCNFTDRSSQQLFLAFKLKAYSLYQSPHYFVASL